MPYVGDELFKYIRKRMADFLMINVVELLPHLPCLTQMDLEKIKAEAKHEGNESAVPILLDYVRRRQNWERQLIDALRSNMHIQLADDLEHKLESLAPRRPVQNVGVSAFSYPNRAAAASSMVYVVPPPTATPAAVSLPKNPPGTVTAADESESSPRVFPPAGYLPPQPSSYATDLPSSAGAPVPPSSAGAPVPPSPAGAPVPPSPAGAPVPPSPAGAPVPPSPAGAQVPPSPAGAPVPPSPAGAQVPPSPAGAPVPPSPAGAPVLLSPAPTAHRQPSALLVATSNTPASSPASSIVSDSSPQHNSTALKAPIQEMGNVDREESKVYNLPIQEKMVTSGHSKPNDSPRAPKNQTTNSDQKNSGEKSKLNEIFSPSPDQAEVKTKTDQAIADVPSTSRQVHPHRPLSQPTHDDYQDIDKPEVLRSDVANMQSVTLGAVNPSESGCSITSSDLQLSENTVDTSRSNSSDSSSPLTTLSPTQMPPQSSPLSVDDNCTSGASASDDFSDENSVKEQKIQALQGYQNDQLQRSFYDVHSPLNIQLNFDAQKNIGEGVGHDKDILNQNLTLSNTEVAQRVPAFPSTHPVNNGADPEIEFVNNVQVGLSNDTISSGGLMLSSSDSGCSLADIPANGDSVNESRFHAEQGSQSANLLNNTPQPLPLQRLGVQVPAQTDDKDAVRENAPNQNQTTAHECKPEPIGERSIYFDCNQSREDRFTETESNKESSLKVDVSERGGSLHTHESGVSHGKYVDPEIENTSICIDDVRMYSGRIEQEADYENEAGNDHEFEAANLGDFSRRDFGESGVNALSTEHVSLASREKSDARQPVNPNGDLPQSNYVFVSMTVLVLAVVAGCVWKYCHK